MIPRHGAFIIVSRFQQSFLEFHRRSETSVSLNYRKLELPCRAEGTSAAEFRQCDLVSGSSDRRVPVLLLPLN
jgi:hypothetical protein